MSDNICSSVIAEREEREEIAASVFSFFPLLCTTKAYWLNSFQASPPGYMLITRLLFVNSVVLSGQQPHDRVGNSRGGGGGWMDGCRSGGGGAKKGGDKELGGGKERKKN